MAKLRLTFACWSYDRTGALAIGSVAPEGIDLNCLDLPVEETFFRMLRHREFDVAEMSLSSYSVTLARDDPPFIAIPVFPSRMFRHSCIFVSEKSGIREPKDLVGKRIGTPEYQMTAPVWIRGILQDEYGVDPAGVTYHTGGVEETGRVEKVKPRPAGEDPRHADRPEGDAGADAGRRRRSMRCTRRACLRRTGAVRARCGASSTTTSRPSATTSGARGSSRSCTPW